MQRFVNFSVVLFALFSVACVTTGTHEAVVNELAKTRSDLQTCTTNKDDVTTKHKKCDEDLNTSMTQNQQLLTKVSAMGQNVEQLLGEKGQLTKEQQALAKEVEDLRRMRSAAEARNAEYKKLIQKLAKMIDAGTLQVKVRNGRMLVQMSSDVVFPPGGTKIKSEASEAIRALADSLKQFPDRRFQVIGHSDSTPIKTDRFPSNWELSSQRAIEVVKLLIDSGVKADNLSAAGAAEFDPVAANDTNDNKTLNRRVEIVFMPKIDELPGFQEALNTK